MRKVLSVTLCLLLLITSGCLPNKTSNFAKGSLKNAWVNYKDEKIDVTSHILEVDAGVSDTIEIEL
ncbi:MAG: hypothetical protein IKR78_03910, partial [Dehalococcoidales bacterium]|nr:hypothetical protein [Dehalococcoidales bacterium]